MAAPAKVRFTIPGPKDRKAGRLRLVNHTKLLSVRAMGGDLGEVSLTSAAGEQVPGKITGTGGWRATQVMLPASKYTFTAAATNADGVSTTRTRTFRTTAPAASDLPAVTPLAGRTVGVGHPIVVYFDYDVEARAMVEENMSVDTSRPVKGSWGWIDARTVAWRPKKFWPANTDVTVNLDLAKKRISKGVWVMEDRTIKFRVGRSQVMRISNATHQMQVIRDGKTVRTVPVSMGKPGFTTRSGTKVIMTQERTRRMDSSTVGISGSESYDLVVEYALRLTSTGEFIHAAPWSTHAQGNANVSHGCTNVSMDNAAWLYSNTLVGDPVVTTGTGRSTEEWNGLGGIWNFSWNDWLARSATS